MSENENQECKPLKPVKNAISLQEAKRWSKRWSKQEGDYNKHHHVHAFLIPKIDIQEVLTEGIDAVRAYIGVDDNGKEKLMIVGTKYDATTNTYMDLISNSVESENTPEDIYDFTEPCPSACDPESPMFK